MKVAFFGTPHFAVPSLKKLASSLHDVTGVVTAPDKPRGRGQQVVPTAIATVAEELGLPILKPVNLKDPDFQAFLRSWEAELFAVVAFRILPEAIFSMPAKGSVNLHASLLPAYRGAAPVQWALWHGETETGLTTFQIEQTVDTGNILKQRRVEILADDDADTLGRRLAEIGADLLLETVEGLENSTISPQPQDPKKACPAPKITKDHCQIDWQRTASEIHNQVRALSPYPGAFTYLNGQATKILRSEVLKTLTGIKAGTLSIDDHKMICGTGKGELIIQKLQLQGKNVMDVDAFLRGFRLRGTFDMTNTGE